MINEYLTQAMDSLQTSLNEVACDGYQAPYDFLRQIGSYSPFTANEAAGYFYESLFGAYQCQIEEPQAEMINECDAYGDKRLTAMCNVMMNIDPEQAAYVGAAVSAGAFGLLALKKLLSNKPKNANAVAIVKPAPAQLIVANRRPAGKDNLNKLHQELFDAATDVANSMGEMVACLQEELEVTRQKELLHAAKDVAVSIKELAQAAAPAAAERKKHITYTA